MRASCGKLLFADAALTGVLCNVSMHVSAGCSPFAFLCGVVNDVIIAGLLWRLDHPDASSFLLKHTKQIDPESYLDVVQIKGAQLWLHCPGVLYFYIALDAV